MAPQSQREFVELLHGLTDGKVQLPSHIFPKKEDATEVLVCVLKVLGLEVKSVVEEARDKMMSEDLTNLRVSYKDSEVTEQGNEEATPSGNCVGTVGSSSASPAITISEHPSLPVTKDSRSNSPRIIPTYDDLSLENLTQCNQTRRSPTLRTHASTRGHASHGPGQVLPREHRRDRLGT